jgi:hypothetical protein
MYETSPDCFVTAPFLPEKGLFAVRQMNARLNGDVMKTTSPLLLPHSYNNAIKSESMSF